MNSRSGEFTGCCDGEDKENFIQISMSTTHRENQSLLTDATELNTIESTDTLQEEVAQIKVAKKKRLWNVRRMVNYFGYVIMVFGIVITLSSTYVNIWNTIRYVRFTPPCIVNATVNFNKLLIGSFNKNVKK